jgi:hypothetical protein
MPPVLLDAMTGIQVTDPTAVILAGAALAVNLLIAVAAWLYVDREKSKVQRVDAIESDLAAMKRDHDPKLEWLQLRQAENRVDINALLASRKDALTVDTFDRATFDQNRRLEDLKEQSKELVDKVTELEKGVVEGFAKRPTLSQGHMPAARAPTRRSDGVGDRELPADPPPMRKKAPSVGRYGGE